MRDDLLWKFRQAKSKARKWLNRQEQIEEPYKVRIKPGPNPHAAAKKLATYIVNRWMPDNAGGVHFMLTPQLVECLLPFFRRDKDTIVGIAIIRNRPVIKEMPCQNI